MTRMFTYNGKRMITWNPFIGCNFECSYCWARPLVETRLKRIYPNGFKPIFYPEKLNKKFKPNDFVFISSLGDISFIKLEDFDKIDTFIRNYPQTNFLLQTKNPDFFICGYPFPQNTCHGITLETNRDTRQFSKAPIPQHRYEFIILDKHPKKFVSIEPIMDFDLDIFTKWILDINPQIVEIGADNYHHSLPEPTWDKITKLINILEDNKISVIQKQGLARLNKP